MNRKAIALALATYALAIAIAAYASGFALWRLLWIGVAVTIAMAGHARWKRTTEWPFCRYRFRFELCSLGRALKDANIYTQEQLKDAMPEIFKSMLGHGQITFTWLEWNLIYLNTHNGFNSDLDFYIQLQTFRGGRDVGPLQLSDMLEMRRTAEGYDLVLISAETRGGDGPRPYQYPGLTLFTLPHSFLSALQGKNQYRRHDNARAILERVPGINYYRDDEIRDFWEFRNQYGSFRWWVL